MTTNLCGCTLEIGGDAGEQLNLVFTLLPLFFLCFETANVVRVNSIVKLKILKRMSGNISVQWSRTGKKKQGRGGVTQKVLTGISDQ